MRLQPTLRDVMGALAAEGHLDRTPHEDLAPALAAATPWYLTALMGLGGWVAALFLLGFLLLAVSSAPPPFFLVAGLFLCGAAVGLRFASGHPFVGQLCLAGSMAGAALVIGAAGSMAKSVAAGAGAAIVLEVGLVVLYPDRFRRTLSAAVAGGAFAVLMARTEQAAAMDIGISLLAWAAGGWWLARSSIERTDFHVLHTPVGRGLTLSTLATLLVLLMAPVAGLGHKRLLLGWLTGVGLTLGLVALVALLLHEQAAAQAKRAMVLGATLALGLVTLQTPGVAAAAAVLVLALRHRDAVLLVMGAGFLSAFGVAYYYNLQVTLLVKSAALLGSGVLLLAARHVLLVGEDSP